MTFDKKAYWNMRIRKQIESQFENTMDLLKDVRNTCALFEKESPDYSMIVREFGDCFNRLQNYTNGVLSQASLSPKKKDEV